jgi:membrane-associated phospholipid phosphatase
MGDAPFWMIVVLVTALAGQFLKIESLSILANLLIVGLMFSNIVFSFLKNKIKRKRPYADEKMQELLNIKIINRDPKHGSKELESFPSGHAHWTSLCVCIIVFQFGYISFLLVGWMIPVMMFLRPYLGVHYPSDAVAGFFIGVINAMITICLSPIISEFTISMKKFDLYNFGYWIFILVFLTFGFRSWLKRV